MHEHGVKQEALRAISLASYHHAQNNPRAVMYGRPLDEAKYDDSRWIVEPFHLFDCCQENDGAAAVIVVPAERAKDLPHKPAYLLGVAQGSRSPLRARRCTTRRTTPARTSPRVAPHLYDMAKLGPTDIDVVQCYENFTGGVLMSLVEHGFCAPEEANDFLHAREPDRADGQAAAEHQRRQPGRVLHARAGAGERGGAPDPRRVDQPGAAQ